MVDGILPAGDAALAVLSENGNLYSYNIKNYYHRESYMYCICTKNNPTQCASIND